MARRATPPPGLPKPAPKLNLTAMNEMGGMDDMGGNAHHAPLPEEREKATRTPWSVRHHNVTGKRGVAPGSVILFAILAGWFDAGTIGVGVPPSYQRGFGSKCSP